MARECCLMAWQYEQDLKLVTAEEQNYSRLEADFFKAAKIFKVQTRNIYKALNILWCSAYQMDETDARKAMCTAFVYKLSNNWVANEGGLLRQLHLFTLNSHTHPNCPVNVILEKIKWRVSRNDAKISDMSWLDNACYEKLKPAFREIIPKIMRLLDGDFRLRYMVYFQKVLVLLTHYEYQINIFYHQKMLIADRPFPTNPRPLPASTNPPHAVAFKYAVQLLDNPILERGLQARPMDLTVRRDRGAAAAAVVQAGPLDYSLATRHLHDGTWPLDVSPRRSQDALAIRDLVNNTDLWRSFVCFNPPPRDVQNGREMSTSNAPARPQQAAPARDVQNNRELLFWNASIRHPPEETAARDVQNAGDILPVSGPVRRSPEVMQGVQTNGGILFWNSNNSSVFRSQETSASRDAQNNSQLRNPCTGFPQETVSIRGVQNNTETLPLIEPFRLPQETIRGAQNNRGLLLFNTFAFRPEETGQIRDVQNSKNLPVNEPLNRSQEVTTVRVIQTISKKAPTRAATRRTAAPKRPLKQVQPTDQKAVKETRVPPKQSRVAEPPTDSNPNEFHVAGGTLASAATPIETNSVGQRFGLDVVDLTQSPPGESRPTLTSPEIEAVLSGSGTPRPVSPMREPPPENRATLTSAPDGFRPIIIPPRLWAPVSAMGPPAPVKIAPKSAPVAAGSVIRPTPRKLNKSEDGGRQGLRQYNGPTHPSAMQQGNQTRNDERHQATSEVLDVSNQLRLGFGGTSPSTADKSQGSLFKRFYYRKSELVTEHDPERFNAMLKRKSAGMRMSTGGGSMPPPLPPKTGLRKVGANSMSKGSAESLGKAKRGNGTEAENDAKKLFSSGRHLLPAKRFTPYTATLGDVSGEGLADAGKKLKVGPKQYTFRARGSDGLNDEKVDAEGEEGAGEGTDVVEGTGKEKSNFERFLKQKDLQRE